MLDFSMMKRPSLAISVAAPSTSTRNSTSHCMASTCSPRSLATAICVRLTATATPVARIEIFGQRIEREKNDRGQKIQKQLAQRGLHEIPLPIGEIYA